MQIQIQRACEVQAKYTDMLMQLPHVIGVGVGFIRAAYDDHRPAYSAAGVMAGGGNGVQSHKQVALVVMVDRKVDADALAPHERIPAALDGIPIAVQEMGVFTTY
jgi:hypothetical protein